MSAESNGPEHEIGTRRTLRSRVGRTLARPVRFALEGPRRLRALLRLQPSCPPAVTAALQAVHSVDLRLAEVSRTLEQDFLTTGAALETLQSEADKFLKDSELLVAIATGQADGRPALNNGIALLQKPLAFLNECRERANHLLERLGTDQQRIAQLLQWQVDMERAVAPLRFMQARFRIEAAPLGEEAQVMFTSLTQDIGRLHQQISELFDTKFKELHQARHILQEVETNLGRQAAALGDFVTREQAQIQESFRQLEAQLSANHQRDARIRRLSAAISNEVREVVVALQFQDIIHQRLEHLAKGLRQIQALSTADAPPSAALNQACHLELEQLQAVRRDLTGAGRQLDGGIESILGQLNRADVDCLSLREYEQVTTSADGMVQVLLDVIAAVRHQVGRMVSTSASVLDALRPLDSMASSLTSVVRQLSHQIHLIGLNAQIQAAQVSNGAGLEVLSARTSEISCETSRLSESVAHQLDQIGAGLAEIVKAFHLLHTQSLDRQDQLNQESTVAERDLHLLRDEAFNVLHRVADAIGRIEAQAENARSAARGITRTDASLSRQEQRLQTLVHAVGPVVQHTDDDTGTSASRLLAERQASYTMASEREVFHRVIQRQTQPLSPPTPVLSTTRASKPPPPPPPPEPIRDTTATATATATANVSSPSHRPAPSVAQEDLGDNVELF